MAPQDSLVHLVCVRQDPIVQVETQQAQVGSRNTDVSEVFFMSPCLSSEEKGAFITFELGNMMD